MRRADRRPAKRRQRRKRSSQLGMKAWLRRVAERLRPAAAEERWGWIVTALTLVVAGWLYARTEPTHLPVSDGFYSYLYARSMAFDGDIDFGNDYSLCGDPFRIGIDRGTGHPDNIYYPGPALFWTPLLWVLRLVLPLGSLQATCGPPWTTWCFAMAPLAGALVTYLSYRVARRWFTDGVAALSAALLSLAGLTLKFSALLPCYSHIYDAVCVSGLLVATLRALEDPARWRKWILVSVLLAMCVLQRLSNVAFAIVPLFAAATAFQPRWCRRRLIAFGIVVGLGLLPSLCLMGCVYRYLYGHPFVFTHGRYFIQLAHPHPWLMLFDREEGLFFFTPTAWLAVLGLGFLPRTREPRFLLLPLLGVAVFEWWLSASTLDWAPARRLTNLTPLLVLLACFPIRWLGERLKLSSSGAAAVGLLAAAPFVAYQIGYVWGVPRKLVATERPLTQSELYGASMQSFWAMLDETVGTVAVIPAELAFGARYGLPRNRFGDAAFAKWYRRDFRSLRWLNKDLPFNDRTLQRLMVGFEPNRRGARPQIAMPRLVFSAQWPFATHVEVRTVSQTAGTLRLGRGKLLGQPLWFGAPEPLHIGVQSIEFEIPEGGFSSGINEFVFQFAVDALADVLVTGIRLDDRTERPPPFAP